jgi:hypothetical protein
VNINTFRSNAMSKKPRNRKAEKSGGLIDAMSPDERRRVAEMFAALEQSITEHRQFMNDHAAHVAAIEAACKGMVGQLPSAVRKQLAATFDELIPAVDTLTHEGKPLPEFPKLVVRQIRAAAEAGFFMAVVRYREWLVGNREVDSILRAREDGLRKGHAEQKRRSDERAKRIRDTWAAMEAAGERVTNGTVAARCGCGVRTVIRAFSSKPNKRPAR